MSGRTPTHDSIAETLERMRKRTDRPEVQSIEKLRDRVDDLLFRVHDVEQENEILKNRAKYNEQRLATCEDRTCILDAEDLRLALKVYENSATKMASESAAAALAQMTAEFTPIAARARAVVAGVAKQHEVENINMAFNRALDKMDVLKAELAEAREEAKDEKETRIALEVKLEEMYQWFKQQNL